MTLTQYHKSAKFGPKTEMCSNLYVIWHLKQIEHAHYEYSAWNWGTWPKIIDSDKFQPNTEYCSDFYEIWYSQQIGHADYEYNICQCLEHSPDYWPRMIIESEWL